MDAATVAVSEAYERAFVAIEPDPRNEMMVLVEGFDEQGDGDTAVGCLQVASVPGLGKDGAERALIEAVRIRADRRGGGLTLCAAPVGECDVQHAPHIAPRSARRHTGRS